MGNPASRFSPDYLDRKRRELTALRDSLTSASDGTEAEEASFNGSSGEVKEYEDDAQRLDELEKDGNLMRRDVERLGRVERALDKITQGTYGLSDVSGEEIPEERLEAMPDAVKTLAEQDASERAA